MIGIYRITNNINGKFYIGQSINIARRWKEHCSPTRYKTSHIPVEWAIHKYGKENFSFEVLEECEVEELNRKETWWILHTNAIEKGYNCNEGGDTGTRGQGNPNSKLTLEDVIFIRKVYDLKTSTQKEIYSLFEDKIAWSTFRGIWEGSSWSDVMPEVFTEENKEYYKKKAGYKVNNYFSDEEVMSIRKQYVFKTAKELYSYYSDRMTYNAFQFMLCGFSYNYLPYYHKKTKTWIYPGEEPKKNENRVLANKGRKSPTSAYTDEEVLSLRREYMTKSYKELYEESDKRISEESFQSMLCGKTYKNIPIYSKTKKQWL